MSRALVEALRAAAVQTCRDVLTLEPAVREKDELRSGDREVTVVISFVGGVSGAFVLRCSRGMGAAIAGRMLGTPVPETSDEMKDALGEFLNMVVGDTKTRYAVAGEPFRMSVPTTVVGDHYDLQVQSGAAGPVGRLTLILEGLPLCIEVYLK